MEFVSIVLIGFLLVLLVGSLSLAYADMGAIVPVSTVTVEEPSQKAIIAFNQGEEVLILSTELQASAPTQVIRFIPFPSEPIVSLAPDACFQHLAKLFTTYQMQYLVQLRSAGGASALPVELRFHEHIGAHDVTIVRIHSAMHFEAWINEFFAHNGLPERRLSPQETAIIADYVHRGFPFFVFDLVELGPNTESVAPLVYRFPTRHFYYPLKTSNLFKTVGGIELFVFGTYQAGQQPKGVSWMDETAMYVVESNTVSVTNADMCSVAPEINDIIGHKGMLQAFQFTPYGVVDFLHDVWLPRSPLHEYYATGPFGKRL